MTILYKVNNGDGAPKKKCVVCKISVKNIIAFGISETTECCTSKNSVSVCDLITPWEHHSVCTPKIAINALEWNYTGALLLVAYTGMIEIWTAQNQTLNSWAILYQYHGTMETVVACKFFHNGKSLYFHSLKRDSPSYAEKFERLDTRPTITQFGTIPVDGVLIITKSGVLGTCIIPKITSGDIQSNQITELNFSIYGATYPRSAISCAGITYCPTGSLNVALCYDSREEVLHCYKYDIQIEHGDKLIIKSESFSQIFLELDDPKEVVGVIWTTIRNENVVFVAHNAEDGSFLEQWNLFKRHQIVNSMFQKNKSDCRYYNSWERTAKLQFPARMSDFRLSKVPSDSIELFAIYEDNTAQIIEPELKKVGFYMFDRCADDRLVGCRFSAFDLSAMNQILIIFDNYGQMLATQVMGLHVDKSYKHNTIALQVSHLEYCILSGTDASDILMVNLSSLDVLIEKLTENFTRQPPFTRHFYYTNFLSLKSSMCRIQSKQQDFDNLIILHSISITFKSLLRPSDLSYQDKSPADNLSIILSEPVSDVDKVLFNLDAKDFTVEPLTLQSLQQLIQWVADLALNILNKLPEEVIKSKMSKKQGYDISRDIVAIGSIRELLVMIRIWGLLNSQCLPIYAKSVENIDVLSILFRLLTRLAQNTNEPDEYLLDECSILSNQVVIPPKQFKNPTTLLNCHMSLARSFPFVFSSTQQPFPLQDMQLDEVVFSNCTKDGVSNLYLGAKVHPIRRCIRCGFINNFHKVAKTSALKAWCNRWIYCHCSGYWKVS